MERIYFPLCTYSYIAYCWPGLSAVQNVAKACVEGGVTELVQANVDYLSHHITTRLKRAHHNPGVLSVLSVVMRHTTVQVLPCLHEIIEDVSLVV